MDAKSLGWSAIPILHINGGIQAVFKTEKAAFKQVLPSFSLAYLH
jgi:hypothetical protein